MPKGGIQAMKKQEITPYFWSCGYFALAFSIFSSHFCTRADVSDRLSHISKTASTMPRAKQNMVMMITVFEIPRATPRIGAPACRTKVEDMSVSKLPAGVPVIEPTISGSASAITTKYKIAFDSFLRIILLLCALLSILYDNAGNIYK
jgi:hypothetical protein